MACVRFAKPSSLGVTEPFLTQKGLPTKDLPFPKTFSMKAVFRVRNGSVTPREEGFAKRTQVMLLGGWSTEDVV